ncbi:MAG: ATP-binding protein [Paludibacteraceae bacterium]|nr:ATP-binding protein [Paludibacteraceae bacterium]
MLLAIELENFFSIKNKIRLDFRAGNINTTQAKMLKDNLIEWNGQKILKTIGLFGPNASGKSSIIRAIKFCCMMVLESHQHNENTRFNFQPFKFDGWQDKPSRFYIDFVCEGIEYEYEYTLTTTEILTESLYYYPNHRKTKIFERKGADYLFGTKVLERPKDVALATSNKNLFLSRASSMNRELAKTVYRFFLNTFLLDLVSLSSTSIEYNFNKYKQVILKALEICDSDICDIKLRHKKVTQPVAVGQDDQGVSLELRPVDVIDFKTYHKIDPSIQFDMERDESDGTQRLFAILNRMLDVVSNNKSLMLDEFDRQLHTLLADFLIDLVHASPQSQLLFTSHNTNLIDMDRFRKDQIVFVNKKADGATEVYSLYDFRDFRDTMDAEKGYLTGRFDAIPIVTSSASTLRQLMKGGDE